MSDTGYDEHLPPFHGASEDTDFFPALEREPVAHELRMQLVRYFRQPFEGVSDGAGVLQMEVFRPELGYVAIVDRVTLAYPTGTSARLYANSVSSVGLLVPIIFAAAAAGEIAVAGNSAMLLEGEALIFRAIGLGANFAIGGNIQMKLCRLERLQIGRADKDFADAPEIEQGERKLHARN